MKSTEERLKSYEPLWENWHYTGELLGEGGMSDVFEICSDAFGSKEYAALKIITVKGTSSQAFEMPSNALNEINILRTLSDCVNIVRYYDSTSRNIYDDSGNLCGVDVMIRMEKLKALSEGTPLDNSQIINLASDICHALVSASEKGIIHRDIKPQNIFVTEDGTFKLGDFGISKIVTDMDSNYTKDIGTLAYAAPEICSINRFLSYDVSSDIYSLGLVLYTFLNNGYLPFVSPVVSTRQAVEKRIKGDAFPSPPNGSEALKRIVMRACAFDPKRRYLSAREMLEDLDALSDFGSKKVVVDPFKTLDATFDTEEIISSLSAKISALTDSDYKKSGASGLVNSHTASSPEKTTASRFIGSMATVPPKSEVTSPSSDKPKTEEKKSSRFFKTPEL